MWSAVIRFPIEVGGEREVCEHIVVSLRFGIVGSLCPDYDFPHGLGVRVSHHIGYDRRKCCCTNRVFPSFCFN